MNALIIFIFFLFLTVFSTHCRDNGQQPHSEGLCTSIHRPRRRMLKHKPRAICLYPETHNKGFAYCGLLLSRSRDCVGGTVQRNAHRFRVGFSMEGKLNLTSSNNNQIKRGRIFGAALVWGQQTTKLKNHHTGPDRNHTRRTPTTKYAN